MVKNDIIFDDKGFEIVEGAGWKWKCPICKDITVISNDLEYLEHFRETHIALKHRISKKWREENR